MEGVDAVATTATDVWVTNHHAGTVAELDPRTGAIRKSVRLVDPGTGGPQNLLAERSDLWVEIARDNTLPASECGDESLSVIDRSTGCAAKVPDASRYGYIPNDVTAAFGSVWVTARRASQLLRVDPATKQVMGPARLAANPHGPGRDRTCDLGIKSPLLYQLSYRPRWSA
jgi:streptogramin lyase